MTVRRVLGGAVTAAAVVFLIAMIAGQVLGQPVLLSYVTSGSMEPTLQAGDGFVAIPAVLAGPVEEGAVITFRSAGTEDGELTTHRVVGETDRGYITRGDANPFTDQDGGDPPVSDADVVAVAWQPGGEVLALPGVGTAVTAVQDGLGTVQRRLAGLLGTRSLLGEQGLAYLLLGLSAVGYVLDLLVSGDRKRDRDVDRGNGIDARVYVGVFAAALVLSATATMVAPAGPTEFGVVSAESDAPGIRVVERGTTESTRYVLGNGGHLPMVTYLEPVGDGVNIDPRATTIPARSQVNATLSVTAPPETGYYRYHVIEHRYLGILPGSTIDTLYRVHPWLPIVVIDLLIGGTFFLVGTALVGTGRVRSRNRDGPSRTRRLLGRFGR